ncbi:MAG: YHYH protein, partial [Actinomycetota bacterium]
GDISWKSAAKYAEQSTSTMRTITTMRVPTVGTTGEFPIAKDDPAYQYDRNPSAVTPRTKTVSIPMNPVKAAKTSCLPMGAIGVAKNGVMLYNALDARNMDARAHEMQDSCEGHPNFAEYHYHAGSACVVGSETGSATLFGYAFDGFGIYVERDKNGNMLDPGGELHAIGHRNPFIFDDLRPTRRRRHPHLAVSPTGAMPAAYRRQTADGGDELAP